MNYQDFRRLRMAALDCSGAEQFIAEEGGSVDCERVDALVRDLTAIYEIRTMRQLRALTGLSQAAFAAEYGTPRRTVEDWERVDKDLSGNHIFDMLTFCVLGSVADQ